MVRVVKEMSVELQVFLHMFHSGKHDAYEVTENGIPADATIEETAIDGEMLKITFSYVPVREICPVIKRLD